VKIVTINQSYSIYNKSNNTSYFLLHLRTICNLFSHNFMYVIIMIPILFLGNPETTTEDIYIRQCNGKITADLV